MTPSSNVDDFEPDDFEPDVQDDFVADDFEPEEPKKKSLKERRAEMGWLDLAFSKEGAQLQKEERHNQLKSVVSGVTAGFSQAIPGLEVDPSGTGSTVSEVAGSLLPITAASKAITTPLTAVAKMSPKYVPQLTSFANLLGISAAGGLYEGLEESAEKSIESSDFVPPSVETIAEQGAKWAILDAALRTTGWGYRFAKGIFNKSAELKVPATELLESITDKLGGDTEKIAEKALSILENKPINQIEKEAAEQVATKDFSAAAVEYRIEQRAADLRNRKIEQKDFSKIETVEPKPYLPVEFEAENIAENTLTEELDKRIQNVSQRAPSELDLGKNVKADIERTVETAKKETDALYEKAKIGESEKFPNVKKTADSIVEQINKLDSGLNLTPEGYSKAEKQLRNMLTDLGYAVEQDANGKVIRAIENSRQPLSKVVEVKRRINNIINYDLIDTSAQDFLKGPAHELRGEIRQGYGDKSSEARKAFEEAEKKFGEFAEKKGKKSVRNMRTTEKPESIAKTIKTPSGLADVKDVVSKEQFAQVERELLEHLRGLDEQKASNFYREMRPSMTSDSRSIAEEIIQAKAPKNSPSRKIAQREAIQKKSIDDIAKATITGERPQVALDLWKTTEGQQLIKNALEKNPNKEQVLKYLQEQSFKDFYSSVISPDGLVDFKKLDKLLQDKATLNNIRMIAGEDGVNFVKNLETLSDRVKKNVSTIENKIDKGSAKERDAINKELKSKGKERIAKVKEKNIAAKEEIISAREAKEKTGTLYKLDEFINNTYGIKGKAVLGALGMFHFGPVEGIMYSLASEGFIRMIRNKKVQQAFNKAAAPNSSPAMIRAISELADELD